MFSTDYSTGLITEYNLLLKQVLYDHYLSFINLIQQTLDKQHATLCTALITGRVIHMHQLT